MVSRRLLQVVAVVAMLLAVAATGAGANVAYAAPNDPVPFEGMYSGAVAFTGKKTAALSGSGTATHLGAGPYSGDVSKIKETKDGGLTDVLVETLVAANGDTLTILCNQVAVQTSPGVYEATDTWTVIGGTGQFENAAGEGTGVTHIDLNLGVFDKQLTGTISAPNSN